MHGGFSTRLVAVFCTLVLVVALVPAAPATAQSPSAQEQGAVSASEQDASSGETSSHGLHATAAKRRVTRILCVGNSWTERSIKYLCAIAKSAGRKIVVGHAFLSRSSLQEQYFGLVGGGTYFYTHGQIRKVRTSYVYHKYRSNGSCTTTKGSSLKHAIQDEPWDYLVLQNRAPESGLYAAWDKHAAGNRDVLIRDADSHGDQHGSQYLHFDVNDFVDLIKSYMRPRAAAHVKVGLVAVWSYAEGQKSGVASSISSYIQQRNGGVRPSTQTQWNALYRKLYRDIQATIPKVATHMGKRCNFIVNPGKAFCKARKDKALSKFGFRLHVSSHDAHPADGLPCYLAGLTYAFGVLGISWKQVAFYTRDCTTLFRHVADADVPKGTVRPTARLALRAIACAWHAQHAARLSVRSFAATPVYARTGASERSKEAGETGKRRLRGVLLKGPHFGTLQRNVDFRIAERKVDARSGKVRITYRGMGRFRGKVTRSFPLAPGRSAR